MKKWIIALTLMFLFTAICCRDRSVAIDNRQEQRGFDSQFHSIDSIDISDTLSVIGKAIEVFGSDSLTSEERAYWDSMNNNGGYMLIRGAERNLDTIINYVHLIFTTEK